VQACLFYHQMRGPGSDFPSLSSPPNLLFFPFSSPCWGCWRMLMATCSNSDSPFLNTSHATLSFSGIRRSAGPLTDPPPHLEVSVAVCLYLYFSRSLVCPSLLQLVSRDIIVFGSPQPLGDPFARYQFSFLKLISISASLPPPHAGLFVSPDTRELPNPTSISPVLQSWQHTLRFKRRRTDSINVLPPSPPALALPYRLEPFLRQTNHSSVESTHPFCDRVCVPPLL